MNTDFKVKIRRRMVEEREGEGEGEREEGEGKRERKEEGGKRERVIRKLKSMKVFMEA